MYLHNISTKRKTIIKNNNTENKLQKLYCRQNIYDKYEYFPRIIIGTVHFFFFWKRTIQLPFYGINNMLTLSVHIVGIDMKYLLTLKSNKKKMKVVVGQFQTSHNSTRSINRLDRYQPRVIIYQQTFGRL